MADALYTGLTCEARQTPAGDQVVVGVVCDGAFFPLGGFKAEGFAEDVAEGKAALAEAAAAEPAPAVPDPSVAQTQSTA